mgnify:CR=1 FL=1
MSAEHDYENDDENDATGDDSDAEQELYETVGPDAGVSRRDVLKGLGAGAAATVGGAGTAYADHGGSDPLADGSDTSTDTEGSFLDNPTTYGVAATLAGPAGAFGLKAVEEYDVGEKVADALFDVFDNSDSQLQSDTYYHGKTVQQSTRDMLGVIDNHLDGAQHRWIADAKYEVAKKLKNGATESEAVQAARNAVYDAAANLQRNIIKAYEAVVLRHHQFSETVRAHSSLSVGDVLTAPSLGLIPFHVELFNGEQVATWGMAIASASNTDTYYLVHPYAVSDGNSQLSDNNSKQPWSYIVESESELQDRIVSRVDAATSSSNVVPFSWSGTLLDVDSGSAQVGVTQLDSNNPAFAYLTSSWYSNELGLSPENTATAASEHISMRVHNRIITAASDAEQIVTDAYSTNIDPDKIATDMITDPVVYTENVAGDWRETGTFGYAQAIALSAGYESDLDAGMDVQVTFAPGTSDEETITYKDTSLFLDGWSPEHSTSSSSVSDGDFTFNFDVSGGDTVAVPQGTSVDVSHASASITSVTVEANYGGSTYTLADVTGSSVEVAEGDLETFVSDAGYTWGDTVTLSVTAQTSSASGSGSVDITLAEFDAKTGTTYTVPSGQSAYVVERAESGASLVTVESGDEFTIQSLTDADGNSMGGLTLQNSGRYTVDNTDIIQTINRQKENQQEIDEKTGGGGGGSGGGSGMPVPGWLLGGGIVTLIVYYVLGDEDGFDI